MASDQEKISKVFLDSSVFIAAAISPTGSARDLIMSFLNNKFKVVVSDLVLEETEKNLSNKAPKALPIFRLFLEILQPEVVRPPKSLVARATKVLDTKVAPIVAGAIQSKADFLASYDRKHLLQKRKEIKRHFDITVTTPDEIIK